MRSETITRRTPTAPAIPLQLAHYSIGVGDRFARESKPQLLACILALESGVNVIPVWNKSNREHDVIGSLPESVRSAAESAVKDCGWEHGFHVDADHINLQSVDRFLGSCDFFTIDVAAQIGRDAADNEISAFVARHRELQRLMLPNSDRLALDSTAVKRIARKYLEAAKEAGRIYRKVESSKGAGTFITEVSMDETDTPQSPEELLVILLALADESIPLQTIAPKFTGRFNKGVDYAGDVAQFEREFRSDIAAISWAIENCGLPPNLKLSVHSGSDKFTIYPVIRRILQDTGAGLHVKTAGTTWLEELVGMAEATPDGLATAKAIYRSAFEHREELCAPYAAVIDINPGTLPIPEEVNRWTSKQFVRALRHDQTRADYNPGLRQLLHVGYKIAANMGQRYLDMVDECSAAISRNVTQNLYERHIRPIFIR